MPFIVACQSLLLIAYSVLFVKAPAIASNVPLCYVMVALACIGVYPIIPNNTAWTVNNLAGPEKRSMGTGFFIAMGNCGGIVGKRTASFTSSNSDKTQVASYSWTERSHDIQLDSAHLYRLLRLDWYRR